MIKNQSLSMLARLIFYELPFKNSYFNGHDCLS